MPPSKVVKSGSFSPTVDENRSVGGWIWGSKRWMELKLGQHMLSSDDLMLTKFHPNPRSAREDPCARSLVDRSVGVGQI